MRSLSSVELLLPPDLCEQGTGEETREAIIAEIATASGEIALQRAQEEGQIIHKGEKGEL